MATRNIAIMVSFRCGTLTRYNSAIPLSPHGSARDPRWCNIEKEEAKRSMLSFFHDERRRQLRVHRVQPAETE